jgi:diguanylate cyclase (GGDEF)-like protein
MARDITERKLAEAQLKYLSLHDSLTGLYNRAYFDEEMRRLESGRNRPFAIIVCDIDGLKQVNDTMGHQAGDKLLVAAAKVIKESFRCEDLIARIGGDEYAIILPNSDLTAANFASSRLRAAVDLYNENHPSLPLSISVGCAASSDDTVYVSEIFKEADDKMYKEKLYRKKKIRQFSPKSTKRRSSEEG